MSFSDPEPRFSPGREFLKRLRLLSDPLVYPPQAEVLDDVEGQNTLEHRRARELNELLGPKRSANPRADFVIDLHNTTAATGCAFPHPSPSSL